MSLHNFSRSGVSKVWPRGPFSKMAPEMSFCASQLHFNKVKIHEYFKELMIPCTHTKLPGPWKETNPQHNRFSVVRHSGDKLLIRPFSPAKRTWSVCCSKPRSYSHRKHTAPVYIPANATCQYLSWQDRICFFFLASTLNIQSVCGQYRNGCYGDLVKTRCSFLTVRYFFLLCFPSGIYISPHVRT